MQTNLNQVKVDFRLYLQRAYTAKCRVNPKYSLRGFAKFLELDPTDLSKILAGRKVPGARLRTRLALKLGASPRQIQSLTRETVSLGKLPTDSSVHALQLEDDEFSVITDWYHYALLEMIDLKHFHPDPAWIARSLGITVHQVRSGLERLERLKLIKRLSDGTWLDRSKGHTSCLGAQPTSFARREHQRQILAKAIEALDNIPVEQRDQTSMTFSLNSEDIPKARELIAEFRRKFARYLTSNPCKDQVYNLSISLYPITTNKETL